MSCTHLTRYHAAVLILTYLAYTSYHLARKPLSVVKNSLHRNCSVYNGSHGNTSTWCDWKPFDGQDYDYLFGWLDLAFLATYAICMFLSGHVAERMDLRHFLSGGMLLSGFSVAIFGAGYFLDVHIFVFYLLAQILAGAFQSTGWPAVVTSVGNWFGPGRRGFVMGLWNSHTSLGNILGALIPGVWSDGNWGWSFVVPGIIISTTGFLVFLFLTPYPEAVGIEVNNTRVSREAKRGDGDNLLDCCSDEDSAMPLISHHPENQKPISFINAIRLPGVLEFSVCLFFAKLVSYTFLFWLPNYIGNTTHFSAEKSASLSTLFDVGGVFGGFLAGAVTDWNLSPAVNCVFMLLMGTPSLFLYQHFGNAVFGTSVGLLLVCGAFVNGPYALITTAVSAELGTQASLKGNKRALATVTSIIDGTGSIGAALGPLLTGWIAPLSWKYVFYMLIAANIVAIISLSRLACNEVARLRDKAPLLSTSTDAVLDASCLPQSSDSGLTSPESTRL